MSKRQFNRRARRGSPQWEANARAHLSETRAAVAAQGFTVMQVFGDHPRDGHQYTIGLTDSGLPELAVYSYVAPVGNPLLAQAVRSVAAVEGKVTAGTRLELATVDGTPPVPAVLRYPTDHEREHRGVGWAYQYYGRRVRWLVIEPEGWPCPACAPCDKTQAAACTCTFYCWQMYCKHYSGDLPADNHAITQLPSRNGLFGTTRAGDGDGGAQPR